jgi:Spy/CpxP family protein refolding chaperone
MKRLVLFIVAGVLVASNAWAFRGNQGVGPGFGTGPGYGMGAGCIAVQDLTPDQLVQIQAKQEAFRKAIEPVRDKLFSRRMELRDLWTQAHPDQAKIIAKQKEIQSLQNQLQERATQFQLECRGVLTPEQQEKLTTTVGYHGGRGVGRGRGMQNW